AAMRPMPGQLAIESALQDLVKDGRVLVASHPAPDVHLESADLRVIAPVAGDEQAAGVAAESYWNDWLRAFLATHRCQYPNRSSPAPPQPARRNRPTGPQSPRRLP